MKAMKLKNGIRLIGRKRSFANQSQIPFSSVFISLMGDDATTLDPVIVSSCVITNNETAEVTADSIVKMVSVSFD